MSFLSGTTLLFSSCIIVPFIEDNLLGKKREIICLSGLSILFFYTFGKWAKAHTRYRNLIIKRYDDAITIKDVILREYARFLAN